MNNSGLLYKTYEEIQRDLILSQKKKQLKKHEASCLKSKKKRKRKRRNR